ncbi:uncharacterized protein TRIADDRAFT_8568, partial [Trichoplax adhaerens]
EEIRAMARFAHYEQGEPSKVLYIKNLSDKVNEKDLVMTFIGFQEDSKDNIRFRLMKGKMKGQAFVTFSDVATAGKALDVVNGYKLKGKPMVIQYGK